MDAIGAPPANEGPGGDRVFLIVGNPTELLKLVDGWLRPPDVVIGNLRSQTGRVTISKEVHANAEELAAFRELSRRGIKAGGAMDAFVFGHGPQQGAREGSLMSSPLDHPGLHAGFATTPLPFAPGLHMAGYGTRTEGALGTHDALEARGVWLQAGELAVALVSVDLVAVDARLVTAVRQRLADILPADGAILSATHTHAGPVVVRERIGSRTDQPGADLIAPLVEQQVEDVIRMARARARPARTGFARANVAGLGLNRRRPDGPADETVMVLLVESERAEPVAALVRYSCHPTVLDAGNRLYSADFPGIARREIEQTSGVPAVFFNGTAGDVSTRFTRTESSFAEVGRFGHLLAGAAVQALSSIRPTETGPLRLARRQLTLPTRRLPGRAEAEQAVAEAEQRFDTACRQQVAATRYERAAGAARRLRNCSPDRPAHLGHAAGRAFHRGRGRNRATGRWRRRRPRLHQRLHRVPPDRARAGWIRGGRIGGLGGGR